MKLWHIIATSFVFAVVACNNNFSYPICESEIVAPSDRQTEETLGIIDWPVDIRSYFASEFSGYAISTIITYTNTVGEKYYLLEATTGGLLLFDDSYQLVCGDNTFMNRNRGDDDEISIENLPDSIKNYIANNYPGIEIRKAEFDDGEYEVKLENGIELCFDQAGNFLGEC